MNNPEIYCEHLYNLLYVPIYLYDDKELIVCFPSSEYNILPPSNYLKRLWDTDNNVSYTLTSAYSYYGCVKLNERNYSLVIGPVNEIPYTKEILLEMSKEYSPNHYDPEFFADFFTLIPTQNLFTFTNTLLFINYSLNNTSLTIKDITEHEGTLIDSSIEMKYSEETYNAKEEGFINNNYAVESELLRYIETGNLKEWREFTRRATNTKVGVVANDTLRHLKNTFIVTVTLVSRAAMKGGLSPSIAYQLSNIYIQQIERLTNIDAILTLMGQVQQDYTTRVANINSPITADHMLYQAIQYVRDNTNKNITVDDIAAYVGFSRPYLSRKVKKELGFNLSDFIRRCKLEEGKDLLAFSNKSISQISNYLCFSSQSHFQKAFKDKYGITPQTFRNSVTAARR